MHYGSTLAEFVRKEIKSSEPIEADQQTIPADVVLAGGAG